MIIGLVISVWTSIGLYALTRPLSSRRGTRPDPAWNPSRPIVKFAGYDEAKAVAAARRAREREATIRRASAAGSDDPTPARKLRHLERVSGE